MSDEDAARAAAVSAALEMIEPGTTIGLGSGRAVFALTDAIGARWSGEASIRAVVASTKTFEHARDSGIQVVDLAEVDHLDNAFDGADEVDPDLNLIKGNGAAMLREKLIVAASRHVVIMVEEQKQVEHLGRRTRLPVEIIPFGWQTTLWRLESLTNEAALRKQDGLPVRTDEGNFIIDIAIPQQQELRTFATDVKLTLGVVDHGLFLNRVSEVIVGHGDGSITVVTRRTD